MYPLAVLHKVIWLESVLGQGFLADSGLGRDGGCVSIRVDDPGRWVFLCAAESPSGVYEHCDGSAHPLGYTVDVDGLCNGRAHAGGRMLGSARACPLLVTLPLPIDNEIDRSDGLCPLQLVSEDEHASALLRCHEM